MPIIFSLILYTIVGAVISVVLGGIFLLPAYLIVRKKQFAGKWQLLILITLTPGIFIFSEIFLWLFFAPIVSEIYGVDYGIGDYWEAPLNDTYIVDAVDLPYAATISVPFSAHCSSRYDRVDRIWPQEEDIYVSGRNLSNEFTLYVFHQPEGCDTLACTADSLLFEATLQEHELVGEQGFSAEDYFYRTQADAHKIEEPIRHVLAVLILLALWAAMIFYIRKNNKGQLLSPGSAGLLKGVL